MSQRIRIEMDVETAQEFFAHAKEVLATMRRAGATNVDLHQLCQGLAPADARVIYIDEDEPR